MGRFGVLFRKDLRLIARNRVFVLTLIVYPLVMVSVLGLVFADPGRPVPVGMVVGDDGNGDVTLDDVTVSLDVITSEINDVARVVSFDDTAAAQEALRNGEVDAVIVFPDFFLADLLSDFRNRVQLDVILDRSDPAKSAVAESVIRASVQAFNEEIVRYKVDVVTELLDLALDGDNGRVTADMSFQEMLQHLRRIQQQEQLSPENEQRLQESIEFLEATIDELENGQETIRSIALPIDTQVNHIDSNVLVQRDIVVPAAVALSVFWTGILATASLVVYERQSFAQLRLNVSPIGMGPIITSKLMLSGLIIILQSLLIIVSAKVLWNIRIDNLPLLIVLLFASSFAAVGLGLLVAGFARDTNGATLLSVLAVFPMMFLSGLFFPISFMPEFTQMLARAVPLTYAVDGLRGAMLRDFTWSHARTDVAVLVALGGIATVIGFVRSRKAARGT